MVAEFRLATAGKPPLDAHIDTVAVDAYDGDRRWCGTAVCMAAATDDKGRHHRHDRAVKMLLAYPEGLRGKLACCIVVDEECDGAGRGSLSCIAHLPKPDAAMVIDGDCDCLQNGCNGVISARVTVPGRRGDSAYGGLNAIEQAFKLLPPGAFRKLRGVGWYV